jgi:hypothetical protein
VTGSRSRPTPPGFGQIVLCRPDAWVRVSFAVTPVSIVGWIYDPDHSLPPGMYVDVPHLDCLLVAAPINRHRQAEIIRAAIAAVVLAFSLASVRGLLVTAFCFRLGYRLCLCFFDWGLRRKASDVIF